MKKLSVILWLMVFGVSLPLTAKAEFQKTKVAVLDFQLQGAGYETSDMGKIVAEWLITALVREGRFEVVERRLLQKILEEQKLVMTGVVDENSATQLGKLLGVKVIISGSVMKFQNIIEVNARIIDVESASIITAENVKSATAVRLEDLVVQMAEKIIKDFPLEGYIVNRSQEHVTIDLGQRAGVKSGMKFMVFKEGKIIKHPRTGEVLDVEKIDTGKIEITTVDDKIARATILEETSPGSIKYGQLVKSIARPPTPIGRYVPAPAVETKPVAAVSELTEVAQMLEEAGQMKGSGNAQWEVRLKEAYRKLKVIYARNETSPEVYFYYAKAFSLADNLRKANKSIEKAVYYNPDYVEAYVLLGDMNYSHGLRISKWKRDVYKLDQIAVKAYEDAARRNTDKNFQALMYHNIGKVYDEMSGDLETAKDYWQKSVSISPNSEGARLSKEKLAGLPP